MFVKKIKDINYDIVITEAISDYLVATKTILDEFQSYEVPKGRRLLFEEEVRRRFKAPYRSACRRVSDIIRDSQEFYDQRIGEEPPNFEGFDTTPISFRNGVLHMQLDDNALDLKWRLEGN